MGRYGLEIFDLPERKPLPRWLAWPLRVLGWTVVIVLWVLVTIVLESADAPPDDEVLPACSLDAKCV